MRINTDFLDRCINTLESVVEQLQQREPADPFYDTFREASVKEFEIVAEQSGILLRKRLRPYFASNRQADRLDLQERLPARRQTRPHISRSLRTLVRLPGQPERHRAQLWRGLRGDNAPTAAGLHHRR